MFNKQQLSEIIVKGSRYHDQLSEVEEKLGEIISNSFSALANISPDSAIQVIDQLTEYIESLKEKSVSDEKIIRDIIKQIEKTFTYTEE
jgi:hypothetical protein